MGWKVVMCTFAVVCVGAWALLEAQSSATSLKSLAERPTTVATDDCKRCGLLQQFKRCDTLAAPSTSCTLPVTSLLPSQIRVGPLEKASVRSRLLQQQSEGVLEDLLTEVQVPVMLGEGKAYALGGAEWVAAIVEEARAQGEEWDVLVLVVANYDRTLGIPWKEANEEEGGVRDEEGEGEEEELNDFLSLRSGSEGFWFWVLVKGDQEVASHMLLPRLELLSEAALLDTRGMGPFDPNEIPASFQDLHEDPYVDVAIAAVAARHIARPRKAAGAGHRPLPMPRDLLLRWASYFRVQLPFPLLPDRGPLFKWCTLRPFDRVCWPESFDLEEWESSVAADAAAAAHLPDARQLPGFVAP